MEPISNFERTSSLTSTSAEADALDANSIAARTASIWEQTEARAEEEAVAREQCGCSRSKAIKGRLEQNPRAALTVAGSMILVTLLILWYRMPTS